jgi:hypothetical protein
MLIKVLGASFWVLDYLGLKLEGWKLEGTSSLSSLQAVKLSSS